MSRKNEILESVIELFKENGITNELTMSEIASKLDMGKSTIYEYFKTKDQILTAALNKMAKDYTDQLLEIEGLEEKNFEQAFKAQVNKIIQIGLETKLIFEVMNGDLVHNMKENIKDSLKETMQQAKNKLQKQFIYIFKKSINEEIKPTFSPIKGELIAGFVMGSIIRFINVGSLQFDQAEYVDEMFYNINKMLY